VTVRGIPFEATFPADNIRHKTCFVPDNEDRHWDGLMLSMTVEQNLVMSVLGTLVSRWVLDRRKMLDVARGQITDLNILPSANDTEVRKLRGGNQQKVLIGKWLQGTLQSLCSMSRQWASTSERKLKSTVCFAN
jgi:ABC-type sugar transport system ATPase subunit